MRKIIDCICYTVTSIAFGLWLQSVYAGVFMFGMIIIWVEVGE